MDKSELSELRVTVRLIEGNQGVATLERCFGFVEKSDDQDVDRAPKTIDETITDFQEEIEHKALELGRAVKNDTLDQAMFFLILSIIRPSQPDVTLDIPVEKQAVEEKKDDDSNSDT